MSELQDPKRTDEDIAAKRYFISGLVRIGALVAVMVGIMIARTVIEAPYAIGVVLAVGGLIAFFFGPPILAKRWKAGDRAKLDGPEE
ncbi:MAG: hypothetical protein AAF697_06920 [Pseudomonadota bacterium]